MHFEPIGLVVDKDDMHTFYIPMNQCRIIYKNMKAGVKWPQCSPVYDITREQAAFILNNFEEE